MRPEETTAGPAARQLVLLCDGTNNNLTGQHRDTNVVKLAELLAAHPDPLRLVHYDPGVGNPGELPGATAWDQLRRRLARLHGLAFGRGVYENMAETYLFLMRHYRPGDELYIFGFSRGAFTARSVAGLVNLFGILQPHMESMLPTLLHVYFAERGPRSTFDAIARQTSRLFTHADTRVVDIQFIGVWDTVASVGLPPFGTRFTALPRPAGKSFIHIRQALALDEHRSQFRPRLYAGDNGPFDSRSGRQGSLVQLWFPGAHCDAGGGSEPTESALADTAFAWLVSEAAACGLRAGGGPPDGEEAVAHRLAQAHAPVAAVRPCMVHSMLLETPWWALTGQSVRDTTRVEMDDGEGVDVQPVEHASAGQLQLQFARHSAWSSARTPRLVWCAAALMPLLMLALGQLLRGAPATGSLPGDLAAALRSVPDYLACNLAFQRWQLLGWLPTSWAPLPVSFSAPRWALVWDLALIACYATVLSWFAARAFGRVAGLRRAGDPPRQWLNVLGWALPVMVLADLGENLCTWLALTLGSHDVQSLAWLAHLAAAGLSVAKFAGLAGTLALVAAGMWPLRRAPHAPPRPQAALP
jgi:hypothetical protein